MNCKFCQSLIDPKMPLCPACGKRIPIDLRLSKDEFCKLYSEQNMTCECIAKMYGVSTIYVLRLKKRCGVLNNPNNRQTNLGKTISQNRIKQPLSKEDFEKKYFEEKKSMTEIAEIYGVSRQTIYEYKKKYRIKAKTTTDYCEYHVNKNFFSSWNEKMAWVLGLIITDGCVSECAGGSYKLSYQCSDEEIVEKIRNALNSNHPISKIQPYRHTKKPQYALAIGNKEITKDLINLGITPRKSLTVNCPPVPNNLFPHFLRGVYEGDGSATSGRFKIVSGSEKFINALKERMVVLLEVTSNRVQVDSYCSEKTPYYTVAVGLTEALMKLYKLMYEGVDESCYLTRKKIMFEKFLKEKMSIKGYGTDLENQGLTDQISQLEKKKIMETKYYMKNFHWWMKVYNSEISDEKVAEIQIEGPPQPLPLELMDLNQCGRNWQTVVLAEATTGFVRYTEAAQNPAGCFMTNLWSLKQEEARQKLELPNNNTADHKHKAIVPAKTQIFVGQMTSSNIVQFYVMDKTGLKFYDSHEVDKDKIS